MTSSLYSIQCQQNFAAVMGVRSRSLYPDYNPLKHLNFEFENQEKGRGERETNGESNSVAEPISHSLSKKKIALVLFVLAAATVIATLSFLLKSTADAYDRLYLMTAPTVSVTVQPGDTVWGICDSHPVEGVSTYELVNLVLSINDIEASDIQPGDEILLPLLS